MIDTREDIIGAIVTLLEPHELPVYSTVPANEDHPFIFIGPIVMEPQLENKTQFELEGTVQVDVFTGSSSWTGSLAGVYRWINEIKVRLQPYNAFVLPLDNQGMVWWRLEGDGGLTDISDTEKIYVCSIVYAFELTQPLTYYDRVIMDGGTIENYVECVLNKIL